MNEDIEKIRHNIAAYRAAIAEGTLTQQDLDDYMSEVHEARTGKPFVKPSDVGTKPSTGEKMLGTAASLVRDIPGMEAVQSGASALANGISYRDAREQIHGAEDAAPKVATIPARLAGAGLAAMAIPGGSAIKSGAMFGGAHGLLDSNPDASLEDRLYNGGRDALLGGATGAVVGALPLVGRIVRGSVRDPAAAGKAVKNLIPARFQRFGRAVKELQKVGEAGAKEAPAAPKSLDEILGGMEVLPEAEVAAVAPKAQTLEEVIEQTAGKPWKPRSAPKARFEHFAERMAARKAGGEVADLSLEDLLQESLGHVQKGGSLKSASDALKIVRKP